MAYTNSIVPTELNPLLTPELEREVAFFMKWGYLVVENALTPTEVETLKAAVDETVERNKADAPRHRQPSGADVIHDIIEQDDRFAFLIDNPPVLLRMKAILGNCIKLHSAAARTCEPGTDDQDWHRDGPWPVDPHGTPYGSIPGQVNCGYYLDELTMDNGPVVLVPGSHRAPFRPPAGHPTFPDEKVILARAGQAVLFDGWMYHRGAANRSTQSRRVCLMCYQNAWMLARESFAGPRASRLREEGSPERKLLLGELKCW